MVAMPPGCRIFTYQPQPRIAALPGTSQLPPAWMLQTTSSTRPAEAARIGVPTNDMMSTPMWFGFCGVRKLWPAGKPGSGCTHFAVLTGAATLTGAGPEPVHSGGVAVRLTYASDTYVPLASRSHMFVVRTSPLIAWPLCWHTSASAVPLGNEPTRCASRAGPTRSLRGVAPEVTVAGVVRVTAAAAAPEPAPEPHAGTAADRRIQASDTYVPSVSRSHMSVWRV